MGKIKTIMTFLCAACLAILPLTESSAQESSTPSNSGLIEHTASLRPLWKETRSDFVQGIQALADLNGDGIAEYFMLTSEGIHRTRAVYDGATQRALYEIPLVEWDNARLVQLSVVRDQSGDGHPDLLAADCAKRAPNTQVSGGELVLIAGSNGSVLWNFQGQRGPFRGHRHLGCDLTVHYGLEGGDKEIAIISSLGERANTLSYSFIDIDTHTVLRSWSGLGAFARGLKSIHDFDGDRKNDFLIRSESFSELLVLKDARQPLVLKRLVFDEYVGQFFSITDVDNDRLSDIVVLTTSKLVLKSSRSGNTIWERSFPDSPYVGSSLIRSAGRYDQDNIEDILLIDNSLRGSSERFIGRVMIISGADGSVLFERRGSDAQGRVFLANVAGPASFTHTGAPFDLMFLEYRGEFSNTVSRIELHDYVAIPDLPSIFGKRCFNTNSAGIRPPQFRNLLPDYQRGTLTASLSGEPSTDAYVLVGFETLPERYEMENQRECVFYTGPAYGVLTARFDVAGNSELRIDIPRDLAQVAEFAVFQVIAEDNLGRVALGDAAFQVPIEPFSNAP